jgi:hypothetical protein
MTLDGLRLLLISLGILKRPVKPQSKVEYSKVEEKKESVMFDQFWIKYHELSGKPKTDRAAAEKKWSKLSEVERTNAIENIVPYVKSISEKKYIKKARTYLEDRNFNDEFSKYDSSKNINPYSFLPVN